MAKTPAPGDRPESIKPEPNKPESNKSKPEPNKPEPEVQPTEQLPMESAPLSARAAASGGSTGLTEGADAGNTSLFRRHPVASGIVAGAVAVVLVAGLTAWGVGTVVATSLTSSTSSTSGMSMGAPTATPTPGSPAPATGGQGAGQPGAGRVAFRATIQSIDGASWSILTRKGKTVTVTVDSSTQFGTKKAPESASSFAVGDSVIVVATAGSTAGSPVATRVVTANTTPMPGMTTPPNA
jgi:hypothetical protein